MMQEGRWISWLRSNVKLRLGLDSQRLAAETRQEALRLLGNSYVKNDENLDDWASEVGMQRQGFSVDRAIV